MTCEHGETPSAADLSDAVDARGAFGVQVGDHGQQTNVAGDYYAAGVPVSWPVLVGRAPLLADAFQSRPGLRSAVDAAVNSRTPAVITQVVAGDGGTGKTQLAASVFRQALPGLHVAVWAVAVSREAIMAAYA